MSPRRGGASLATLVIVGSGLVACSNGGGTADPASSAILSAAATLAGAGPAACPHGSFRLEPQAKASQQARALVAKLSLRQEISLMHGTGLSGPNGGAGGMAGISSPPVPSLTESDGPGGIGDGATGVTQLPAPIALAATFDRTAARCYGQVIGNEARAKGIALMYGPTVNLVRVPLWGRAFESLGEDPVLSGTMAAAEIKGTQQTGEMAEAKHFAVYNQETFRNTAADNAIVSARTLQELYLRVWRYVAGADPAAIMCAYSTINSTPACQNRLLIHDYLDHELHYAGFIGADFSATHSTAASAKAGLDQEQPGNRYFGKALVAAVRDHRVPRRLVDAAATRVVAQLYRFRVFTDPATGSASSNARTAAAAKIAGQVAEESTTLLKNDDSTLPLQPNISVAVIGPPASVDPTDSGAGTAHVVSPGTVTPLQGIRSTVAAGTAVSYAAGLPVGEALSTIPSTALSPAYPSGGLSSAFHATLTAPQTGTYILGLSTYTRYSAVTLSINGHALFDDPDTPPTPTYQAAIHLVAGHRYRLAISGASQTLTWATPDVVNHAITAAASVASKASNAVVVVSDPEESEAADRSTLTLPSAQNQLVAAVAAANPRTVVVVEAGAAVTMPWLSKVPAVLDQWYPGQTDGTSLAAVLYGEFSPSGHLPVTFPRSNQESPVASARQYPGTGGKVQYSEGLNIGYRWWLDHHRKPLFPFGYGLSYATFTYHALSHSTLFVNGAFHLRFKGTVRNDGPHSGADVAQLYVQSPVAGEPLRQLIGYQRVDLGANTSASVRFVVTAAQLATDVGGKLQVRPGKYRFYVGDSSASAQLLPPVTVRLTRGDINGPPGN